MAHDVAIGALRTRVVVADNGAEAERVRGMIDRSARGGLARHLGSVSVPGIDDAAVVLIRSLRLRLRIPTRADGRADVTEAMLTTAWAKAFRRGLVHVGRQPAAGVSLPERAEIAVFPDEISALREALLVLSTEFAAPPWWACMLVSQVESVPDPELMDRLVDRLIAILAAPAPVLVALLKETGGRLLAALPARAQDQLRRAVAGSALSLIDAREAGKFPVSRDVPDALSDCDLFGDSSRAAFDAALNGLAPDCRSWLRFADTRSRRVLLLAILIARRAEAPRAPAAQLGALEEAPLVALRAELGGVSQPVASDWASEPLADRQSGDMTEPGRIIGEERAQPGSENQAASDAKAEPALEPLSVDLAGLLFLILPTIRAMADPQFGRPADVEPPELVWAVGRRAADRILSLCDRLQAERLMARNAGLLAVMAGIALEPGAPVWQAPELAPARWATEVLDRLEGAIPPAIRLLEPAPDMVPIPEDPDPLLRLILRPALLRLSDTDTHVEFSGELIDLAVRRAGWDIDPGWIPSLGRVIRFHYREARRS